CLAARAEQLGRRVAGPPAGGAAGSRGRGVAWLRGRRTDHGWTVGAARGADKGSTLLSTRAREPTAVTAARTGWAVSATRTGWAASAGGTGRAGNDPFTNPSGL